MGRAECLAACAAALPGLREHPAVEAVQFFDGIGGIALALTFARRGWVKEVTISNGRVARWRVRWPNVTGAPTLDLVALALRIAGASGMRSCKFHEVWPDAFDEWSSPRVWIAWGTGETLRYDGTPIDLSAEGAAP